MSKIVGMDKNGYVIRETRATRRGFVGYIGYGTEYEKHNGFIVHGPFETGYEISRGSKTIVVGVYSRLECKKIIDNHLVEV